MKPLYALALLFALGADLAGGQTTDYPIAVHVMSSSYLLLLNAANQPDMFEKLDVVIDGKELQLAVKDTKDGLLAAGDYKAKLSKDEHKTSYESKRTYELLFPNNKKLKFEVVGQSE